MAGWQTLDQQQPFEIEIEATGETYRLEAGAMTIANAAPPTSVLAQRTRSENSLRELAQVLVDDGLLDITIVTAESKIEAVATMLRLLGAAVWKTELDRPNVVHGRAHRLKVTANPPQKVVIDGEIIGTTPVEVECIPDGLTVFVPGA